MGDEDDKCWFLGKLDKIEKYKGTIWLRAQWKNTFIWGQYSLLKSEYFKYGSKMLQPLEGPVFFKLLRTRSRLVDDPGEDDDESSSEYEVGCCRKTFCCLAPKRKPRPVKSKPDP